MSQSVSLRLCTDADSFKLAVVGAATFLEAFAGLVPGDAILAHCQKNHRAEVYSAYLAKPETRAWVAEVEPGAAPVGYAMLTAPDFPAELLQPNDAELRRIYFFSRFHGQGIAQRLMELAIEAARDQNAERLLLGVHPQNYRAIAFYTRNGFQQIGTRAFHVGTETFLDPVFALTL